jgi:hypothetical protein
MDAKTPRFLPAWFVGLIQIKQAGTLAGRPTMLMFLGRFGACNSFRRRV